MNIKDIRLHNNYDFLRVFAALCITFTHSYNLLAQNDQEPLIEITSDKFDFSFIGLCIFFTISGYLVTKSAANSVSFKNFVWKRFLRIQPVLIVLVLATVFIVGPFYTTLNIHEYFKTLNTWTYFRNILPVFGAQFPLPGVFTHHSDTGVNGSLWTLVLEERLYCIIGLFMLIGIRKGKWFVYAIIFFNLVFLASHLYTKHEMLPYLNKYFIQYAFMFLNAGGLYYLKIPFEKYAIPFFVGGLILSLLVLQNESLLFLWIILLPVTILGFAYIKSPLNKTGKYGDFTYGIYIFSFPIQQALIQQFSGALKPLQLFAFTLLISVPLSVLSWHLLEKKCLSYKNYVK